MLVLSQSDILQWVLLLTLEAGVLMLLLSQAAWRRVPAFVTYIAYQVGRDAALMYVGLHLSRESYFYAYWYSQAPLSILLLSVAVELAVAVLAPGRLIPQGPFGLFANFALASTAMLTSALVAYASDWGTPLRAYTSTDRACGLVATAVLGCTVFITAIFSIRWSPRAIAIGAGLVLPTIIPILFQQTQAYFAGTAWRQLWISTSAAHGASLLIMLYGFSVATKAVPAPEERRLEMLELLETARHLRREFEAKATLR